MGTGVSRSPASGVGANPRAVYMDRRAKQVKQNLKLDVPVLVDIEHGSIHYRYSQKGGKAVSRRIEQPHEGDDRVKKADYFYHSRLQDFGKDASYNKENNWKFYYVSKGPNSAHQKKVYYVFGKGNITSVDGKVTKPSEVKDMDEFTWPSEHKLAHPTDMFYTLELPEGYVDDSDTDLLLEDLDSTADKSLIGLTLNHNDSAEDLKKRLAVKILKAASNIHIYFMGQELRNEDIIGDLRDEERRDASLFKVLLKIM
ncbi:uncharacterized protein LOC135471345 [Liolophura sinensis]|uniref:uncharacterized protein LOC135471345 n=1 Tax=Liolophura sinensis TaxID=3198878 RepID=UPI00315894C1